MLDLDCLKFMVAIRIKADSFSEFSTARSRLPFIRHIPSTVSNKTVWINIKALFIRQR